MKIEYNQKKLTDLSPYRHLRVLDVGAGAVGSYQGEFEAKMGVGSRLTVCDIDDYHSDNFVKTSCAVRPEEDDNRHKAVALAERIEPYTVQGCAVNYIHGSVEALGPLAFSMYDYVMAAPDSLAVREYVNQQLLQLPPDMRPAYIFSGTSEDYSESGILDMHHACYRCCLEEEAFRHSKKKHSCNDVVYRYDAEGHASRVQVSNLSGVNAALFSARQIERHIHNKNLINVIYKWNPFAPMPFCLEFAERREDCPDCNNIRYPEEIKFIEGAVPSMTLREFFKAVKAVISKDKFDLDVHVHRFGEEQFNCFVKKNYCRSCGSPVDVYKHTSRIENTIQCSACAKENRPVDENINGSVESVYGFRSTDCEDRLLDMTLFELGFPIGGYMWVTCLNGAVSRDDPKVETYCFACRGDLETVYENLNLMEE